MKWENDIKAIICVLDAVKKANSLALNSTHYVKWDFVQTTSK